MKKQPIFNRQDMVIHAIFRTSQSLPKNSISAMKKEQYEIERDIIEANDFLEECKEFIQESRNLFNEKFDEALNISNSETISLLQPEIANLLCEALHFGNNEEYELYAYCIMPNHIHFLVKSKTTIAEFYRATASIKSYLEQNAKRFSITLSYHFWYKKSFYHRIRTEEEFEHTINLILNNPVQAKLTDDWRKWEYNYLNENLSNRM